MSYETRQPPSDVPKDSPISANSMHDLELQLTPDNLINDFKSKRMVDQEKLNEANLQRILQEQEELRATTTAAVQENQQLREEHARMQGQLETIAKYQVPEESAIPRELEFTEDELATHGHAKDFVDKAVQQKLLLERKRMEQEFQATLDSRIAELENKTETSLKQTQMNQEQIASRQRLEFSNALKTGALKLGLDINLLIDDDSFAAYGRKAFAPGDTTPWGTKLKYNIDNMMIDESLAMLKEYAKDVGITRRAREANEVPTSTGARTLTPTGNQHMSEREELLAKVEEIQEMFLSGRYPGSQEEYLTKKAKILADIDKIPLTA